MYGKYPKGLLVVLSNCKDPAQERAFNDWYDTVRVPDVIATGWVSSGIRYRHVKRNLQPDENRYLTIYETDRWDMEDMLGDLRTAHVPTWRGRGRCNINLQIGHSGVFRKCGPSTRPEVSGFTTERTGKAPVTGLLVVFDTCTEPSREASFNNWYNRMYAPAAIAAGLFHTAYRYANTVREPDGRRLFISLYETDSCLPNNEIELLWHQWKTSTARAPDAQLLSEGIFAPV